MASIARLCRICQERPVQPARAKIRDYRCSRCRSASPNDQRYHRSEKFRQAQARYNQSPKRAAVMARRIRVFDQCYGAAETPEMAEAIKAHIRRRVREFREGQ